MFSSVVLLVSCQSKTADEYKYNYLYTDLAFEMPKVERLVFPNNQVSIADFEGISSVESLIYGDQTSGNIIPAVNETTPVFRNIYVKNHVSRNTHCAMFFNGLPE